MAETIDSPIRTPGVWGVNLLARSQDGPSAFALTLTRPECFSFQAGQRISLRLGDLEREYSLASAPAEPELRLLVRRVEGGRFSGLLAGLPIGALLHLSGPAGYFTVQHGMLPIILVATGTGIAPFCAMARDGLEGFLLLHGVRSPEELLQRTFFTRRPCTYRPCISRTSNIATDRMLHFAGRVTDYLATQPHLPQANAFYLCGRREMVRDVTRLVDRRFPGSKVFSEIFH